MGLNCCERGRKKPNERTGREERIKGGNSGKEKESKLFGLQSHLLYGVSDSRQRVLGHRQKRFIPFSSSFGGGGGGATRCLQT